MMMNNLGKSILNLVLLLGLITLNSTALAEVTANINQNNFYEGDIVTLNIVTNMHSDAKPDLSVLKKDFIMLGTRTSQQINVLNGQSSFKKTWIIELQPKQKGQLLIPSISVGKEKTDAINILISTLPPELKAETSKHVFIETSVGTSDNETYVQQQIPYTVKLYFDSSMKSGEISQPSVENAVVEELTNGKRYNVTRNGRQFTLIEKNFTISPEKSGKLHIPPTIVSGRIAIANKLAQQQDQRRNDSEDLNNFFSKFGNDPFFNDPFFKDSFGADFFNRRAPTPTKPFSIKSDSIDVNVLPVPKSFTGSAWLPAEELSIRDSWTRSPPQLKVGEPVTRTLVIRAKGLGGSQIPVIDIPKPDGIKTYPEQPTSKTHTDGVTLIGRQYFDISYIPQKAGKITIPEIKINWWNIKTKKQETVTLPAWHLNVAPGVLNESEKIEQESPTTENNEQNKVSTSKESSELETASTFLSDSGGWKRLALIGILILVLPALFYIINLYRKRSISKQLPNQTSKAQHVNINVLKADVNLACDNNDKQAAAKALLKLAQAQWNDASIQNLGALMAYLNKESEGIVAIKELEQSLYSPNIQNSQQWKGDKLKAVINKGLQKRQEEENKPQILEPLYPF